MRQARQEFGKRAPWAKLILARVSIIAQLSLPTERARFCGDFLGLGDETLLLIEHRKTRVSQFVIWRDGDQPLAQIDRFIELAFVYEVDDGVAVLTMNRPEARN